MIGKLFRIIFLLSFAWSVFAQLNQNCTVSVLNRNTQVDANGNWRIDNVPSTFGPQVARATCINNGVLQSGQSSPITIQTGAVNGFDGTILLGTSQPIPTSLGLTSSTTSLTNGPPYAPCPVP
jgi:hypothetical protein